MIGHLAELAARDPEQIGGEHGDRRGNAIVALVKVFIRVSDTGSATFTRDQYPTSLGAVTLP